MTKSRAVALFAMLVVSTMVILNAVSKETLKVATNDLSTKPSPVSQETKPLTMGLETASEQKTKRAQSKLKNAKMLISDGCSGSTITQDFIRRILSAHGFNILKSSYESFNLNPRKNPFLETALKQIKGEPRRNDSQILAYKLLYNHSISKGQTLVNKISPTDFLTHWKVLEKMGVDYVYMSRRNALDICVCYVRDCILGGPEIGYPVFGNNGTKTDLCFKRRKSGEKIQAFFKEGEAKKCLKRVWQKTKRKAQAFLGKASRRNQDTSSMFYHDLFAFEYTPDEKIFQDSFLAWKSFIAPLVEQVNGTIILDILRPAQNTLPPLASHRDIIYNFEQVEKELMEDESLQEFIRY